MLPFMQGKREEMYITDYFCKMEHWKVKPEKGYEW
jgi:hypothetical protein